MTIRIRVRTEGLRETIRAARRLPDQAKRELKDRATEIARVLASRIQIAGQGSDRQSARAAATVKARRGLLPTITAGPHPLLFGSEFGSNARWGWYGRPQFEGESARQFRPHRGAASYWFFQTVDDSQSYVAAQWRQAADRIIRAWGA